MRFGNRRSRFILLFLLSAIALTFPSAARAQLGVSFWLGGGWVLDDTGHVAAGLQLGAPAIPVAARGELLLTDPFSGDRRANLIASAVLPLEFAVLDPYIIAGFGAYALGEDDSENGVHIGAGLHVGIARFGAFAEVRRHEPLSATVTTIGVTF